MEKELMEACETLPPDLIYFVKSEILLERLQIGLSVSEMLREIQKEETNGKL